MRFLFLLCALYAGTVGAQSTAIYVSAHQDDWQLFMNPNAYYSIQNPDTKTIILHTTAGDAGVGMGKQDYALSREKGSVAAAQFLAQIDTARDSLLDNMTQKKLLINGKSILRYSIGNTHIYCLRLPDGNGTGVGYPLHANKSLEKFYQKKVSRIHSIDSTAFYTDIADLKKTLKDLIGLEHQGGNLDVHLADTNPETHPGDHSDHQTSSKIVQDVVNEIGNATLFLYQNYSTGELPDNIDETEEMLCAATWGVTTACLAKNGHYATWDNVHNAWIGKQYFITKKIP